MAKHIHVSVGLPNEDEKQAEAAKTVRLRALRLAKQATDQEEASREVARTGLNFFLEAFALAIKRHRRHEIRTRSAVSGSL